MVNSQPPTKWGQNNDYIFLTIAIQDINKPEIRIEPTKLHFKGHQTKGSSYETVLELFDEIYPEASRYRQVSQNHWEFTLKKKDTRQSFWPRLLKTTDKCQWISSNWDRYDEDDGDEETLDGTRGRDWKNIDDILKRVNGNSSATHKTLHNTDTDSDAESMPDLEENSQS